MENTILAPVAVATTETTEELNSDMTVADYAALMLNAKNRMLEICSQSLGAFTNPNHDPSYESLKKEAKGLASQFNDWSKTAEFLYCAHQENPMRVMVEHLTYMYANIREKTKKLGNIEVKFLDFDLGEKQLPVMGFKKFCSDNDITIGHGDWFSAMQNLCLRMTMKRAEEIGFTGARLRKIDDSFKMTELARQFELAKADESGSTPNPVSDRQMAKTINTVISLMIGDGEYATKDDVGFIWGTFSKKDQRMLTMKTASTEELAGVVCQLAHRAITGKKYDVNYRAKKSR